MAGFTQTPTSTDPLELLKYFQEQSNKPLKEKEGIGSKPATSSKDSEVMKFFADFWSSSEEKVAKAREELAPDMAELARRSAEEAALFRMEKGITQSLPEGGARKPLPEGTTLRPVSRPITESEDGSDELVKSLVAQLSNTRLSVGKATEESAPVTAESAPVTTESAPVTRMTQGAGLMTRPRATLPFNLGTTTEEGKPAMKETQVRLKDLGYYKAGVDGSAGISTNSAIKTFQYNNNLDVTGLADAPTRAKLAESKGLVEQPTPKLTLLKFISEGEGGYGAANNGTSKHAKKYSVMDGFFFDSYNKPLTEMAVNELMNAQMGTKGKSTEELLKMNPESIAAQKNRETFAVGAYQIIPKTMWAAVRKGAINGDTVFKPEVQDRIALDFLAGSDRPKLSKFLNGDPNISVEDAMWDLAKQWASAPVPSSTKGKVKGKSYYGSGNKAQHSVKETRKMLLQARDENTL